MCTVGFVLILQICPRSQKPIDGKDYYTVPRVQVTIKNQEQQELLDGVAGCH